jgi:hypothetical protein
MEHKEGQKHPPQKTTWLKKAAYSRLQGLLLQNDRVKSV